MDSSLHEVWTAAQGSPFIPAIGKDSQFNVGFWSLILGLLIAGVFALSMLSCSSNGSLADQRQIDPPSTSPFSEFPLLLPLREFLSLQLREGAFKIHLLTVR